MLTHTPSTPTYRDTVTTDGRFNLTIIGALAARRARHERNLAILSAAGVVIPRLICATQVPAWCANAAARVEDQVVVGSCREFYAQAECEVWEWARAVKFLHDNEVSADARQLVAAE